jgi:hypothetical protein
MFNKGSLFYFHCAVVCTASVQSADLQKQGVAVWRALAHFQRTTQRVRVFKSRTAATALFYVGIVPHHMLYSAGNSKMDIHGAGKLSQKSLGCR